MMYQIKRVKVKILDILLLTMKKNQRMQAGQKKKSGKWELTEMYIPDFF